MIELQTIWGWQPALYLFLGGMGAGTFVVAGIVRFATMSHKRTICIAMWCAIAFLAIGLGLLLLELSAPFRALMMWQSFSNLGSSWMALGAWLLFGAIACCGVAAVSNTEPLCAVLKISAEAQKTLGTLFTSIGMALSLCVAVYTGVLLMQAEGVPFWSTGLLPLLFTVSALDTGVGFFGIVLTAFEPNSHGVSRKLEIATISLIAGETVALVAFLSFMLSGGNPLFETMEPGYGATAAASARCWLDGSLAWAFWGLFVVVGLAVPFVLALVQVICRSKHARVLSLATAICVLVGGCTLRFITLLAGAHVDIVVNTVASFL